MYGAASPRFRERGLPMDESNLASFDCRLGCFQSLEEVGVSFGPTVRRPYHCCFGELQTAE